MACFRRYSNTFFDNIPVLLVYLVKYSFDGCHKHERVKQKCNQWRGDPGQGVHWHPGAGSGVCQID